MFSPVFEVPKDALNLLLAIAREVTGLNPRSPFSLQAGAITAHRIVAVSHGYAWECQTQDGGWGLDGVLRDHSWKLRGIVNGELPASISASDNIRPYEKQAQDARRVDTCPKVLQ